MNSIKGITFSGVITGAVVIVIIMPRLDLVTRKRVVTLFSRGYSVSKIKKRLDEENVFISTRSLYKLVRKYEDTGAVVDRPRRTTPRKITEEMRKAIDQELSRNDELTSRQLQLLLKERWPDVDVSRPNIRRARKEIGWVCTRPHYCQLIREVFCIILLPLLHG